MKFKLLIYSNLLSFCVHSQTYEQLVKQADSLYSIKDYSKSLAFYNKAFKFKKCSGINVSYALNLYNAACSSSLSGQLIKANKFLKKALKYGWTDFNQLRNDTDLNILHNTKKWKKILSQIRKIESNYNAPLQKELQSILEDDQKPRKEYLQALNLYCKNDERVKELERTIDRVDSINLVKIIGIISKYGWVGYREVGNSSFAFFLCIQHADLSTQEYYLPIFRKAVRKKNLDETTLAYLEDRIAMRKGFKQKYGTQIRKNEQTGKYYVYPIEDAKHVDSRRKKIGLSPMSDYLKKYNLIWKIDHEKAIK